MSRTRQRIIDASRLLFNERGPNLVTSLIIATEIGISPGNLYYHFHGKNQIICALLDEFYKTISQLPVKFEHSVDDLADYWPFLQQLLTECSRYRFIFQHSESLCLDDPDAHRRMRKILLELRHLCQMILDRLQNQKALSLTDTELYLLSENLLLVGFNWLSYQHLLNPNQSEANLIERGTAHMASLIMPYLTPVALEQMPPSAIGSH